MARLLAPEHVKLLALPEALHERLVGQNGVAVEAVAGAPCEVQHPARAEFTTGQGDSTTTIISSA